MSKDKKIKVGDYVLPRMIGIVEKGDPPYTIEKIEDGIYTIIQKQGTYEHRLKVPKEKLKRL